MGFWEGIFIGFGVGVGLFAGLEYAYIVYIILRARKRGQGKVGGSVSGASRASA